MTRAKIPEGGHSGPTVELPERWQMETLGKIAAGFVSGGTPSTKNNEFWKGNIPWITSKWLNFKLHLESGEKFISEDALKQSTTTVVPKNNLIFATRVGVGKVAVNNLDLAINQDLAGVLVHSDCHDIRFLAYQLRSDRIQRTVVSQKRGATIQGITRDALKELEIYLPPLAEQRKIAGVLCLVQQAIEQQEKLIALTTELKKTLLHKLFTEGLHGEPQKQTDIGPMPESWNVKRLDDFCILQRGFDITKKEQIPGNIPVVSSGGIASYHNIAKVKGPGVVVGRKGTLGTVHYVDMDYWPHDTTLWVKDFKGHDPLFTSYFLKTLRFERYNSGASNPTLNRNTVHAELVAYPKPKEQVEIGRILRTVENKGRLHERKHVALTALFHTMLHQLMTAQVRVDDLDLYTANLTGNRVV
ncbi:MAG: restriction endonuclease subunit S [Nitrospirales bacterium]